MPEDGYELYSHDEILSLEEFALAAEKFARVFSINKVRLTGGEPNPRNHRPCDDHKRNSSE
jgi:molybdenum cofactor biosynthesis enzyme MoaA